VLVMWNIDAAQTQRSARGQSMRIVPNPYAHEPVEVRPRENGRLYLFAAAGTTQAAAPNTVKLFARSIVVERFLSTTGLAWSKMRFSVSVQP
jgi:hypothetical protein